METKRLLILILLLIPILSLSQNEKLTLNASFAVNTEKVKVVITDYFKTYPEKEDYALIIHLSNDTTFLYRSGYACLRAVGFLEPFGLYEIKGKKVYIFLPQGIRWVKDSSFKLGKPEIRLDEAPSWLITITNKSFDVKKRVRGYFGPKPAPKDFKPKYTPPVILKDSVKR